MPNLKYLVKCNAVVLMVICTTSAGCGHEEVEPGYLEKIPSTDRIVGSSGSIYISPDEKILVYMTMNLTTKALTGLESMDLKTGQRIEHNLDKIPPVVLAELGGGAIEKAQASRGYDAGWMEGKLYLPVGGASLFGWLVVTGGDPAIVFEENCSGTKMLADGPEWGTWMRELESRVPKGSASNKIQVQKYSSAWLGDHYDETTIFWDGKTNSINIGRPSDQSQALINLPGAGIFNERRLTELRVSPDKSYVVFILSQKPKFLLSPFMEESAHVLHLKTGESRVVCRFRMIDNLQWSPDGRRLYLSGNNPDDSRGVYVVEVARVFGE